MADNTKTAQSAPDAPVPAQAKLVAAEPDLVDRIFDYIFADPDLSAAVQGTARLQNQPMDKLKTMVRAEFFGETCYIAGRPATARQAQVSQVLALFNGRNATEVARSLGISRPTVYRYLKQARPER